MRSTEHPAVSTPVVSRETVHALGRTHASGQLRGQSKKIPELDGIRGLAIALVLIYHYANVTLITRLMWSGVDLFFVLSGLLIGGILLDNRESRNYYSTFYARRIHRIFPLYYLMIALLVAGVLAFPHSPLFVGRMPLWAYPLFAQNLLGNFAIAPVWIGVTWSLAVEEQFYLIFPFIVRLCTRKTLLGLMGLCILGAPLLRTIMVMRGSGFEQVYPLLPCRADTLAFGVVAAMIVRSEDAKAWIRDHSRALYAALLFFLALLPTTLKWTTYKYTGTIGYSLFGVTYFLLIVLLLVAPFPLMKKFFSTRWLGWLGTVSYCVYLIHQPVLTGMLLLFGLGEKTGITGPLALFATLAATAATFAIAQASWLILEKPLINRAHLRYRY
jgi:peptidoglycan/LPS O-acetylase OafA/YrhL